MFENKAPSDTISFITDLAAVNAVNVGEYAFTVSLDNEPNYNLLNDGEEIEFEIIPLRLLSSLEWSYYRLGYNTFSGNFDNSEIYVGK